MAKERLRGEPRLQLRFGEIGGRRIGGVDWLVANRVASLAGEAPISSRDFQFAQLTDRGRFFEFQAPNGDEVRVSRR
jgi:hypothetical protein